MELWDAQCSFLIPNGLLSSIAIACLLSLRWWISKLWHSIFQNGYQYKCQCPLLSVRQLVRNCHYLSLARICCAVHIRKQAAWSSSSTLLVTVSYLFSLCPKFLMDQVSIGILFTSYGHLRNELLNVHIALGAVPDIVINEWMLEVSEVVGLERD